MIKKLDLNNWEDLMKIGFALLVIILLTGGFFLGYLYGDKEAIENPLIYGVNKLNELNNDKFNCLCTSESGELDSISFNEYGFNDNYYVKSKLR